METIKDGRVRTRVKPTLEHRTRHIQQAGPSFASPYFGCTFSTFYGMSWVIFIG